MILTIYIIIRSYFLLGAAGFFFINRKKDRKTARESWIKYFTYLIIIHALFLAFAFFNQEQITLRIFLMTITVAAISTIAEMLSWKGSDNLLIPMSGLLVLVIWS